MNQCFPGEAQRRFNSVVVYDSESGHFNTYLNRETADAGLQPLLRVQYVYFAGDTAHFVARYGRRNQSPEPDQLRCVDEGMTYDFETTTGRNRSIGKAGFIAVDDPSVDGTATFYTRLDFDDGVMELNVFDIPTNEKKYLPACVAGGDPRAGVGRPGAPGHRQWRVHKKIVLGIPHHAQRDVVDPCLVAADELVQSAPVAVLRCFHESGFVHGVSASGPSIPNWTCQPPPGCRFNTST